MRVLVVDDDVTIREIFAEIAFDLGYETLLAENGQLGVDLARQTQPDLIVMDVRLPVLDGISAMRRIKEDPVTQHIATVAMSASSTLLEQTDALAVDGHLLKPFDLDDVVTMLAKFDALQTRPVPEI